MEAPPGVDRRADDHELGSAFGRDAGHLVAEAPRTRPHDHPPHADSVRARHGGGGLEPLLQRGELAVEVRVQRQLTVDDERRDEHDPRAAVGREPTGEVERVLRLLQLAERDDDATVGDRLGPQHEPAQPPPQCPYVRTPQRHRRSWYGTEARITLGSTSSRRFT